MLKSIALILFVLGIILLPCLALVLFGSWVSRRLRKRAPTSQLLQRLSPMELLLSACLVAVFFVFSAVRQLQPQSTLGSILNNPLGLLAAFGGAIVIFAVAHAGLTRLLRRIRR